MSLTTDSQERKAIPIYRGFMKYFPDAMALVAQLSLHSNEKHNPGEELHWSKDKSRDHLDCMARHSLEIGTWDEENNCDHAVSTAWRAMANLQIMIEEGTLSTIATIGHIPYVNIEEPEDHDEYAAVRSGN